MAKKQDKDVIRSIERDLIDRPDEIARLEISDQEIAELAESIKEHGLLQPILVHPKGDRFGIIAGDRRYLAHELLGKRTVNCIVKDIPLKDVVWLRAVENIQRVNLTPFEEGHIYAELHHKKGFSIEVIAHRMGKSAGIVKRRMDILRMPDSFQRALHEQKVSLGVCEELWSCPDAAKREYFMELAVEHGITVAIARMWVNDFKKTLRSRQVDVEGAGPGTSPYEEQPIYRACDVCKGPVDYNVLEHFMVCPTCGQAIRDVLKKDS